MTELGLRLAEVRDARAFARYVARHVAESGVGGAPIFAPMTHVDEGEVEAGARTRWEKRLDEPNFGRAFVLWEAEEIVGHVELRGGRIPSELHRLQLGMGMLQRLVGRRHGQRLLDRAIGWARERGFAWIDLGVFAGNDRARRLYERNGFVPVGLREDAFRLPDGTRIDDHFMTLGLG